MTEPIRAPHKEWDAVYYYYAAAQLDPLACCLVELRDRVVALEAAGDVAGNSGHASAAPAVLTVDELADCLPANAWAGPEGYSRQAFARHLLDHPRIGSLLRGEAAARAEVERQQQGGQVEEDLPSDGGYEAGTMWTGHPLRRAAASGEVERQQQGGQADG